MLGFFLYGLGINLTINARLGLSPWGVFHQGLSFHFGITMGTAVSIAGTAILIIDYFLKERIGWGTISNVFLIGTFIDVVERANFIPFPENIVLRFLMMILGMAIISLATFLYMSAQLGSGPRDGMMVAFTKLTNKPVGLIRSSIEIAVLIIGYLLGGTVGWGTLIMSLGFGFFIQTTFKIFKFDVKEVVHRYVDQDIAFLFHKLKK
ncbi:MAG: hypothetical protein Q7J07_10905 [Pelolinea sp.]|nr:hypothetical protein [Pelolinea sp.]